ncbi:MAG: thioredoxin family protein [Armatimonadetes bacterium]|nr:thioredoxin family protein [Armatimonadota bacterium]
MRTTAVAVVGLVVLACLISGAADEEAATIQWASSFEQALQSAAQADKLVMVDVYTDWCGWCKELDKRVYTDPKVAQAIARHFVAVKVDGDKRKDVVTNYKIRGYPTILFVDGKGEEVHRVVGFEAPSVFLTELTQALGLREMRAEVVELTKKVQAGQAEGATFARLTYLCRRLGDLGLARKYMEAAQKAGVQDAGFILDTVLLTKKGDDLVSALNSWLSANPGHEREPEARFELGMAFARAREWQTSYDTFCAVAQAGPQTLWGAKANFLASLIKARFLREEDCNT